MFFNWYSASVGATRLLFRTTVYPAKILGLGIIKIGRYSSRRHFRTMSTTTTTTRTCTNNGGKKKRKRDYFLKALGLTGFGVVTYKAKGTYEEYKELKKTIMEEREKHLVDPLTLNPWQILFLKKFPTRFLSRLWGHVNSFTLPTIMRTPVLGTYSWLFNCNFEECTASSFKDFINLNEYFTRSLKSGIRPVSDSPVVSPADGKVLYFGEVTKDRIEAVKGVTYSAKKFIFGEDPEITYPPLKPNHKLMTCTIYLSPGDYHRYHSPVDWKIQNRLHCPGELWSVAPSVVRIIDGLFNYNERAVLTGNWKYGFFSFTAIGAYNVGSIHYNFDKELKTNLACHQGERIPIKKQYENEISMGKGEEVGYFKLGSSIVLLFEAPNDFQFNICEGQKVKYGQAIGDLITAAPAASK